MPALSDSARTLGGLLETRARELGETPFFCFQGTTCSYAELDRKANAVANSLLDLGIEADDTVCIFLYNKPEYLYTAFALAKIGAIAVPIDTRFTDQMLEHVLSEPDADVVILDAETRAEYEAVREDVDIEAEFFVGDEQAPYRSFQRLLDGDVDNAPESDVSGTDTAATIYVQRYQHENPQGVCLPHFSYLNTAREFSQRVLELSSDDCVFTTLPFYSSYPMQMGVTGAMVAGAEFAFEEQFDRERFWEWIREYEATVLLYLGRMLSVLYNRMEGKRDGETPAEYAVGHGFGFENDGAMIADFEQRFDITVLEAYGITPTATLATSNRPSDRRLGSVGKPVSNAEVSVIDENGWELPPGETGEIVVRPTEPHTMLSNFFGNDALTVEVCRNQWIHTNDVGFIDDDGYLHFVASKTNTIHLGRVAGRISSLEIQSVIDAHPDVRESAVFGIPTDRGDEAIKAAVVPEADTTVSPVDISRHCEKRLTYHKLPRYIEIRESIPRTPSGKIRTGKLDATGASEGIWDRESGYDLNR